MHAVSEADATNYYKADATNYYNYMIKIISYKPCFRPSHVFSKRHVFRAGLLYIYRCNALTQSRYIQRAVTDRCKHCGSLRFHVPTFFQATGQKMINCARARRVRRAVKARRHHQSDACIW